MSKYAFFLILLVPVIAFSDAKSEALLAREEALRALNGFNPSSVLKDYTSNPKETSLSLSEGEDRLTGEGIDAMKQNQAAKEVFDEARTRPKVRANPESPEMRYAESLLENPDEVLEGRCYKEKATCKPLSLTKQCSEEVSYTPKICERKRLVEVKPMTQQVVRSVTLSRFESTITFDLTACGRNDWLCSSLNLLTLTTPCEGITVNITSQSHHVRVLQAPLCDNPNITLQLSGFSREPRLSLEITLTQWTSEDKWTEKVCDKTQSHAALEEGCVLSGASLCLEPNITKTINGFPIQRPCWSEALHYECRKVADEGCAPLLKEGCSQTASTCARASNNRCTRFNQTFECMVSQCFPEKTIYPGKIACSDGSCDTSSSEKSDDMAEGLSRFGALLGAATDVANNQVKSGVPAIFTGNAKECKKHPLGIRDCCTGSGWGDWVMHCPKDLQALLRAKEENRVVYLGNYKHKKLRSRHYVYCVFPTKLSAIVQIQGRGGQLHIPYGEAEYPDCRGLTPEELEHINFSALDLSPLEQEMVARMAPPINGEISKNNEAHIERLKREGRAYD